MFSARKKFTYFIGPERVKNKGTLAVLVDQISATKYI